MYVLCTYVCLCKSNDGADVHQQPIFLFIVYNYLISRWEGGRQGPRKQNQQEYLSAYTESKLSLMMGKSFNGMYSAFLNVSS